MRSGFCYSNEQQCTEQCFIKLFPTVFYINVRLIIKKNQNKIKYMGISVEIRKVALTSTASRSNWNLENVRFVEGGKPENAEKKPRSKAENQQSSFIKTF